MGKWYTRSDNEKNYVVFEENDISREFNNVALGMLLNNSISSLVPCLISQTDNKRCVSYNVSDFQNFQEYLDKETTFDFFFALFTDMCSSIIKLRRYMIDAGSLILDFDKMYIDVSAAKIKFLIKPLWNDDAYVDLRNFFRNVIVNLKLSKNDSQRIGAILSMLNKKEFSIDAFYDDIRNLDNNCITASKHIHNYESQPVHLPEITVSKPAAATVTIPKQTEYEQCNHTEPQSCKSETEKSSKQNSWLNKLFSKKKTSESKNRKSSSMDGLAIPGQDDYGVLEVSVPLVTDGSDVTQIEADDDMTVILTESEPVPKLINKSTRSAVSIDKDIYRIGRDPNRNDLVLSAKLVSHNHAFIKLKKRSYYIVDDNSTNHVFVNGKTIPVNSEFRLSNGDVIKIGSEEFIFEI